MPNDPTVHRNATPHLIRAAPATCTNENKTNEDKIYREQAFSAFPITHKVQQHQCMQTMASDEDSSSSGSGSSGNTNVVNAEAINKLKEDLKKKEEENKALKRKFEEATVKRQGHTKRPKGRTNKGE